MGEAERRSNNKICYESWAWRIRRSQSGEHSMPVRSYLSTGSSTQWPSYLFLYNPYKKQSHSVSCWLIILKRHQRFGIFCTLRKAQLILQPQCLQAFQNSSRPPCSYDQMKIRARLPQCSPSSANPRLATCRKEKSCQQNKNMSRNHMSV